MPEFYIQAYKAQSDGIKVNALLDNLNAWLNNVWDDKCLKTIRELPCMPMYCSKTDETIIQIKNKKKDCNTAFQWYVMHSLYNTAGSILVIDAFFANLKKKGKLQHNLSFLEKNLEVF